MARRGAEVGVLARQFRVQAPPASELLVPLFQGLAQTVSSLLPFLDVSPQCFLPLNDELTNLFSSSFPTRLFGVTMFYL
jgi:hypothetical protein